MIAPLVWYSCMAPKENVMDCFRLIHQYQRGISRIKLFWDPFGVRIWKAVHTGSTVTWHNTPQL